MLLRETHSHSGTRQHASALSKLGRTMLKSENLQPVVPTKVTLMLRSHTLLVTCLLLSASVFAPIAVLFAENPIAWLRGSGQDLEIRLTGQVFDASQNPANGFQLAVTINSDNKQTIQSHVDGNRFELWLPVNQQPINSVTLKASLPGNKQLTVKRIAPFELRQAAIEGIQLTLQVPTKEIDVKVTDAGMPVAQAWVSAELSHTTNQRLQTDQQGIVRLRLLPDQSLTHLTAWTDDFRIGGYGFDRTPARDPDQHEHVVELSRCRNLKARFVDEDGFAVPNLDFQMEVATPPPYYNFVGQPGKHQMTTDENGEATYPWFPDWEGHYFYATSNSPSWYVDEDKEVMGDTVVFHAHRSRNSQRRRIHGTLRPADSDVAGIHISLQSFQGDRKNHSDFISTYTNADGTFSAEVLPDATYCVNAIDTQCVSNIIDLIPYRSETGQTSELELMMSAGQSVEVQVTSGSDHKPLPNLMVSFETAHSYSWLEEGERRNGSGGRRWYARTDEHGLIKTLASPGKLQVSVYSPLWQTQISRDVSLGHSEPILLHRALESPQRVSVQLLANDELRSALDSAEIWIGAVGGVSKDRQKLKSNADGSFTFDTMASPVGIFAYTQDGNGAGWTVVEDLHQSVTLNLQRTADYLGRLQGSRRMRGSDCQKPKP
jgi:hypothetical protein